MLVEAFNVIAIEDLNVAGILKNHKLARPIAESRYGIAEFRRQLEYQAAPGSKTVIVASL
jgi:putative transposase